MGTGYKKKPENCGIPTGAWCVVFSLAARQLNGNWDGQKKTCPKFIDENKVKWRENKSQLVATAEIATNDSMDIHPNHVGPSCVYELW